MRYTRRDCGNNCNDAIRRTPGAQLCRYTDAPEWLRYGSGLFQGLQRPLTSDGDGNVLGGSPKLGALEASCIDHWRAMGIETRNASDFSPAS